METEKPSLLSHSISILLLPFNVTVTIPLLLVFYFQNQFTWGADPPIQCGVMALAGIIIVSALFLLVSTILNFARRGKGTLAPWDPPKRLVITGPYRYSRNPMISAVILILFGQVIMLGSVPLLLWFIWFATVNALYIVFKEEPLLTEKFGDDYLKYKSYVPRFFPRLTPWTPKETDEVK